MVIEFRRPRGEQITGAFGAGSVVREIADLGGLGAIDQRERNRGVFAATAVQLARFEPGKITGYTRHQCIVEPVRKP